MIIACANSRYAVAYNFAPICVPAAYTEKISRVVHGLFLYIWVVCSIKQIVDTHIIIV